MESQEILKAILIWGVIAVGIASFGLILSILQFVLLLRREKTLKMHFSFKEITRRAIPTWLFLIIVAIAYGCFSYSKIISVSLLLVAIGVYEYSLRRKIQQETEPDKKIVNELWETLVKLQPLFNQFDDYSLHKIINEKAELNDQFLHRILMLNDWFRLFQQEIQESINLKILLEKLAVLQLVQLLKYSKEVFKDFYTHIERNGWPSTEAQKAYEKFEYYYNEDVVKQLQAFFDEFFKELDIQLKCKVKKLPFLITHAN